MTIVLVHGNPETDAIWDDLRQHLTSDVLTLSPPGFGAPVPDGFGATSDEYVGWLADELRGLDSARIDLVGHDWGGGHVVRLVAAHPELVHSWATDIAGCFDPEYVWHERAQVWQTPGEGEAAIAQQQAAPLELRAKFFEGLGMSSGAARRSAEALNETMGRCILSLYRSAAQPKMTEWGADVAGLRSRPGLVIIATEDHYTGGETLARRTAERTNARVEVLNGLGHWWMCQDPKRGADMLNSWVASLPEG